MVKLEKFTEEDIPDLLKWLEKTDAKFLYQFAGPKYHYPLDKKQIVATLNTDNFLMLKVIFESNDEVIGHCQFMRIDKEKSKASIGRILLNPEKRGQGFGFKLMNEMKNYAKHKLKIAQLYLRVFDFNSAAIECYRKAGFIIIGVNEDQIPEFNESWKSFSMECTL